MLGRTHKITEHHGDVSALANSFYAGRKSWHCSRWSSGCWREHWRLVTRLDPESGVPERGDAKFLQVLGCQARENRFVNLVLTKDTAGRLP